VAYCEGGRLSPAGWPECLANLADCELVERCTDEVHKERVASWLSHPNGDHGPCLRSAKVRSLYAAESRTRELECEAVGLREALDKVHDLLNRDDKLDADNLNAADEAACAVLNSPTPGAAVAERLREAEEIIEYIANDHDNVGFCELSRGQCRAFLRPASAPVGENGGGDGK
jgi:hypothetical protein